MYYSYIVKYITLKIIFQHNVGDEQRAHFSIPFVNVYVAVNQAV